jgi:translation elongation factor EF-4
VRRYPLSAFSPSLSFFFCINRTSDDAEIEVINACAFPSEDRIEETREPLVLASIITPTTYLGRVMDLCQTRRGVIAEHTALGGGRTILKYHLPLAELASDFFAELKGLTSGYATLDYEEGGSRRADLTRMDILLNGKPVGE